MMTNIVLIRNKAVAVSLFVGLSLLLYIAFVRKQGAKGNKALMDLAMRCMRFGAARAVLDTIIL